LTDVSVVACFPRYLSHGVVACLSAHVRYRGHEAHPQAQHVLQAVVAHLLTHEKRQKYGAHVREERFFKCQGGLLCFALLLIDDSRIHTHISFSLPIAPNRTKQIELLRSQGAGMRGEWGKKRPLESTRERDDTRVKTKHPPHVPHVYRTSHWRQDDSEKAVTMVSQSPYASTLNITVVVT